jgi:hypothetical protein
MKHAAYWNRLRWMVMFIAGCWLFEGGCLGIIQRELEVLVAPGSNSPLLVRNSYLYEIFGPRFLAFMSQIT